MTYSFHGDMVDDTRTAPQTLSMRLLIWLFDRQAIGRELIETPAFLSAVAWLTSCDRRVELACCGRRISHLAGLEWARVERKREEVIAKLCVRLRGLGGWPCQAGARVFKSRPWKPRSLDQRVPRRLHEYKLCRQAARLILKVWVRSPGKTCY